MPSGGPDAHPNKCGVIELTTRRWRDGAAVSGRQKISSAIGGLLSSGAALIIPIGNGNARARGTAWDAQCVSAGAVVGAVIVLAN